MGLEKWVDLSKWQGDVPTTSLRAMKADGVAGICVGSWHGIDANPYVRNVLSRALSIGLDTATYYVFNNRPGRETVERAIAACGQEQWDYCLFHAPDVEIRGITEAILRDGLKATEDSGGWPIIYTGNWFWNWWAADIGRTPDFTAWPSWVAVYNGRPDLSIPVAPGLGTLRIHQYTGSTQAYGTTVDFNVANKDWMNLARERFVTPPRPEPELPPVEPPKEEIMGEILDLFTAAGKKLEVEIAKAMTLPEPIPGPQGEKGDSIVGPVGPPGPAGGATAPRTYTVKSGDTLSAIANKYSGVTWQQIYEANKATIGDDPNLIQPGMVLVIPQ